MYSMACLAIIVSLVCLLFFFVCDKVLKIYICRGIYIYSFTLKLVFYFIKLANIKNTNRNNVTVHDTFDWHKPVRKFLLKFSTILLSNYF